MRVFLSYSTHDQVDAEALRRALAGQRPDLDVYFAPHRNEVGAYWLARLERELAAADAVVVLLGERVGPWQELEYFDALRRNRECGRPLVAPVLLGETVPGLPFVHQLHCLDGRGLGLEQLVPRIVAALDQTPAPEEIAPWRQLTPYRGLLAMETQDAAYFFGRELLTTRILGAMAMAPNRLHVLVGNSGVGKSSVALAGVIGSLRSQLWPSEHAQPWPEALADSRAWPVIRLAPGNRPLLSLARAFVALWRESPAEIEEEAIKWQRLLADGTTLATLLEAASSRVAFRMDAEPPSRVVLYVDQAEELYSRSEPNQAQRLSELLAEAAEAPGVLAMMSLRSDYYGRLQEDAALYPVVRMTDVPPLDRAGIERVVRLPAERLGARFESEEVIEEIVAAAVRQPGALPMLSDLLADAWRAMQADPRADGVLRLPPGFVDIARPLADKAERFVASEPDRLEALRRLFTLKLALLPREGEIMRRRARRAECGVDEWRLVEAMAGARWRLVTMGEEAAEATAEVAHEALLRHWPRVVRWLDEAREFLVWKSRFESDYRSWEEAGDAVRSRTLLTGLALEVAVRWREQRPTELSDGERLFIGESEQAAAAAGAAAEAAERRLQWQRRAIYALVVLAFAIVAGFALYSLDLRDRAEYSAALAKQSEQQAVEAREVAEQQRQDALRQAGMADARRLAMAAAGLLDESAGENTLAGLLAAESLRLDANVEGLTVMRRVLDHLPAPGQPIDAPWPFAAMRHSGDGRVTAFLRGLGGGSDEATGIVLRVRDAGEVKDHTIDNPHPLGAVALAPDGRRLAGIDRQAGRLLLWDVADGKLLADREIGARSLGFSGDSRRLVVAAKGRRLLALNAEDGSDVGALGAPGGVGEVALMADRRTLVSFGVDGRFRAWDGELGRALWSSREDRPDSSSVEISEDGLWFADRPADGSRIEIGATVDGHTLFAIPVSGPGQHLLSPDGRRLVWLARRSGDAPGELRIWDLETREQLGSRRVDHSLFDVTFLPRSSLLAITAGRGRRDDPEPYLELVDSRDGRPLWRAPLPQGYTYALPRPMGPKLLAMAVGQGGRLLTDEGELEIDLGDSGAVIAGLAIDAANMLALARRPADGAADLIELRTVFGGGVERVIEAGGSVAALAASVDGERLIAAVSVDGRSRVRSWRLADGEPLASLALDGPVTAIHALAGGRLAVHTVARQLDVWSLPAGRRQARFAHGQVAERYTLAAEASQAVSWLPGLLQVWDLDQARLLEAYRTPDELRALAISPDGAQVAWLGGDDGRQLRLWRVAGDAPPAELPLEQGQSPHFAPGGRWLSVRTGRDRLRVLDGSDLRPVAEVEALPAGRITDAVFGTDGSELMVTEQRERQRGLRVFRLAPWHETARIDLTGALLPLPGTHQVGISDRDGAWQAWNTDSVGADRRLLTAAPATLLRAPAAGRMLARVPPEQAAGLPQPIRERVTTVPTVNGEHLNAWTTDPAGDRLAVVSDEGIAIQDAHDGRPIAEWPEVRLEGAGVGTGPHARAVRGLRFVGAGDGLAAFDNRDFGTAGQRARLWLWHWIDGPAREIGDGNPINQLALSGDGHWLATAEGAEWWDDAADRRVAVGRQQLRLWNARNGELLRTLPWDEPVDAVAFSPDGSRLAARSAARVDIYATADWQREHSFPIDGKRVAAGEVVFAGNDAVATEAEGGVWLWSLADGTRRHLRHGRDWPRIEVSADGARLLTSDRTRVAVWSVADGQLLFDTPNPDGAWLDVWLGGDDDAMLAIDAEGLLQIRWRRDELLATACARLARGFTDDERRRYLRDPASADPCAGG
ncbi:MAG: TIR domain-containing protein [Zoogloeaceae bacterium]|nr:TIR domain-containing protein [Zoogloeaceae bacterium]